MPSTYSSNLRLELQATGENTATWGTKANNTFEKIEDAICGYVSVALSDANYSLTTVNGTTDEARMAIVDFTGTLTAARTITIPSVSKVYYMRNSTTGGFSLNVKTSGGNTITVANGNSINFFCDGTNCVKAFEIDIGEATSGTLPVANGGTGSATAADARTALGVAIGTNVQAWDANLDQIAALAVTDGNFIVGNGTAWVAESGATARTSLGLGSLATASTINNDNWSGTDLAVANGGTGASDATTARSNLGLVIGTNVQAWDTNLDQIAALAVTDGNFIVGNGSAWVAESGSTARTSLGLGTSATVNTGTSGATIPLLSTSNTWSSQQAFSAGSAGTPSISFSGDTNTGFYSYIANEIGISTGGVFLGNFSQSGLNIGRDSASTTTIGTSIQEDGNFVSVASSQQVIIMNRQGSDGVIQSIRAQDVEEGSISVSGTTVSFNSFVGSHWSQLHDGSRQDILPGTICETIDELCEWPDESNNRLAKFKVSDTPGTIRPYGVFLGWDDDDDRTNDAYIAGLGVFNVRMAAGTTVQGGDWIESAGNGCGRVMTDFDPRKHVATVTAAVTIETYKDGSYLVPCTIHCG